MIGFTIISGILVASVILAAGFFLASIDEYKQQVHKDYE